MKPYNCDITDELVFFFFLLKIWLRCRIQNKLLSVGSTRNVLRYGRKNYQDAGEDKNHPAVLSSGPSWI